MKVEVESCDQQGYDLLSKGHIDKLHNTMMLPHQSATNESPTHLTAEYHVYHL
jgi:hypothetical protein